MLTRNAGIPESSAFVFVARSASSGLEALHRLKPGLQCKDSFRTATDLPPLTPGL
ncbi:hypothetical protein SAMN02745166_00441 [Prosthecobacter debontii]|uniref:Uncharacterized protein n=1 Tax=Prosthecobacter debontii TaxID=48467 RepID=A0A1T4WM03_9BACT|nr:hypothetical protein SAMN02745166_00441 [Prosthecobacter debontii]